MAATVASSSGELGHILVKTLSCGLCVRGHYQNYSYSNVLTLVRSYGANLRTWSRTLN